VVGFLGRFKKAQGVFGGGAMVVCAFVIMWAGISSNVTTDNSLRIAVEQATDIDPSKPDPSLNGRLVIAAGAFRADDAFEDQYLKSNPALIVRRRVEMMQWIEFRSEGTTEPRYSLNWSETQVDFFSFQVPQGHENPLFQVKPEIYRAAQSRFGGFDGGRLLPLITRLDRLQITPDLLKDPAQEVNENKIIVRRSPGSDLPMLGDMRVWYEVLPQGDYTVLTVQHDERNLVGAAPSSTLFIRKGLLSSQDFLTELEDDSSETSQGAFYLGGLLLFFGCLSLMMPHAAKFDLTPHLNVQGSLAVLVVSAVVSFLAMALFFISSLLG